MIDHTYEVLEFYRLLSILSRNSACPLGRSDCLSRRPTSDPTTIHNELKLVSEMRLLLKVKGFVSLGDADDVSSLLRQARVEGSRLEPDQLLSIARLAKAYQQMRRHLLSQRSLCPGLWELLDKGPDMQGALRQFHEVLDPNGSIKDNASGPLKRIREKKSRLRLELQKKLESIQRSKGIVSDGGDRLVTLREGRYVVPLRSDQKQRVEGIIHDFSQTRATCFVEPLEVIGDNNRLAELLEEERVEESRILSRLTQLVREIASDLKIAQHAVGRLDGLCARARFCEMHSCVAPEMGSERRIHLRQAQNPILLAQAAEARRAGGEDLAPVPVDILLESDQNALIISGPNRGGKTVTLKTLGLLSAMAQAGIHIPAKEGSYLPIFEEIMAEIGDEQDMESGLSTFSAHASHLGRLVTRANNRSLVIIDEPGMGTDPDEGAALAMAVLDDLSGKGAKVAVATHLNRLKTYGLLQEKTVNASVEFDGFSARPTFRLQYGSPGVSHALDMAKAMGIPVPILERARGYLNQDEVHLNRLIQKLNRLMAEAERTKEEAEAGRQKYEDAERDLKARLREMEAEKRALMDAKRAEVEELIGAAREELKKLVNMLKQGKKSAQAAVTQRADQVSSELLSRFEDGKDMQSGVPGGDLRVGQWVYHTKLKQKGVVDSVDPSGNTARVMVGALKVSAPLSDLEAVQGGEAPGNAAAASHLLWNAPRGVPRELNVVGYRVDEALPIIERAMDMALVEGDDTLRIIHGFGTGRLREAIREHVKKFSFVRDVHSADSSAGGDAITVVELT